MLFGCSGVHMLSIYSNQCESHLPPCQNYSCLNQSILSSLSLRSSVYTGWSCLFSQPVQHNNSHSIHWPFLIQLHANTFTYIALPFSHLLPLPAFLCHTHINPPTPTPRSLHWPPITRSHSLETIVKQLKHLGSIKSHIIHVGGWRLQKSYWQKAMKETGRMAEFQTQENCNVPKL